MQGQSAIIMDMRLGIKVSKFVRSKCLWQVFGPQSNLTWCETRPRRSRRFFFSGSLWPSLNLFVVCLGSGTYKSSVTESLLSSACKWNLLALLLGPEARINQDTYTNGFKRSIWFLPSWFGIQTTYVFNSFNTAKLAKESNPWYFCSHRSRALNTCKIFLHFHMHIIDWCVHL